MGEPKLRFFFLSDIPYINWSSACFEGCRYSELTSNATESWNFRLGSYHHLPIKNMIDSIRCLLITQMSARLDKSLMWKSVCCPNIEDKLEKLSYEGVIGR